MDIISQIFQTIGFLFSLVVLAFLWRRAFRPSEIRTFWVLLASAWTFGMLGTIVWIVHDLTIETELGAFSIIDLFYVLRYVLLGYVLWLYPAPLSRRAWLWVGGAMLAANVFARAVYFEPAVALIGSDWVDFWGQVMYLILDVGIIALAWLRVRAPRPASWNRYVLLLFCAMLSYGAANTINLTEYIFSLSGGTLQNVLWMLTDVFALILVLRIDPQIGKSNEE
ncbi:MAG: hypothetical protein JW730_00910 [Anaerolineales bacterium]|nr:hypothetical protein [Anaerolineales bacterium]